MDHQNFDDIHDLLQRAIFQFGSHQIRAKVALMSEHDPQYPQQALPDPYYGGDEGLNVYSTNVNQVRWRGLIS